MYPVCILCSAESQPGSAPDLLIPIPSKCRFSRIMLLLLNFQQTLLALLKDVNLEDSDAQSDSDIIASKIKHVKGIYVCMLKMYFV